MSKKVTIMSITSAIVVWVQNNNNEPKHLLPLYRADISSTFTRVSALSLLDAQKSRQTGGCFKIIFSEHFQCDNDLKYKGHDRWMDASDASGRNRRSDGLRSGAIEVEMDGAIVGSGRTRNMQWIREQAMIMFHLMII